VRENLFDRRIEEEAPEIEVMDSGLEELTTPVGPTFPPIGNVAVEANVRSERAANRHNSSQGPFL